MYTNLGKKKFSAGTKKKRNGFVLYIKIEWSDFLRSTPNFREN